MAEAYSRANKNTVPVPKMNAQRLNLFMKNYIMWCFFLLFPLTNAFLPNLNLGVVQLNPFRVWLLLPLAYFAHLFVNNQGRIKISKESLVLFIYIIFSLVNSWWKGHFILPNVLNYLFPILFIITIENLEYEQKDFKRLYRVLGLLSIATFLVSLYQNYVNHSFYAGLRGQRWLERYVDFGHYRHASIFRSIDFYQAGIAIGMLCLIFMFLNRDKIRPVYAAISLMMLVSTYLTYTRSNWIIPIIGLGILIFYKPLHQKILIAILAALLATYAYLVVLPMLQESEVYQRRVAATTYEGRFQSIEIYFEHFFGRNFFTGFGIDSSYHDGFRSYGRPEVHNGYIEIFFRDGLIGFLLYFTFWFYLFRRGLLVRKFTGNAVFLAWIAVFLVSNMIYKFVSIAHFGYLLMILYLNINYQVGVKAKVRAHRQASSTALEANETNGKADPFIKPGLNNQETTTVYSNPLYSQKGRETV